MALAVATTATTTYTAATSIAITKPSGLAAGEVLVAMIGGHGDTSCSIDTASGWTSILSTTTANIPMKLMYKVADSSDALASNFTFTGTSVDRLAGGLLRLTGAAIGTIDGGSETDSTGAGAGTISFTGTTTPARDGSLIILAFAVRGGNDSGGSMSAYTTTPAVTLTELLDTSAEYSTEDPGFAIAYGIQNTAAQITAYGATLSGNKTDHVGILAVIRAAIDANGTTALLSPNVTHIAPSGSAGTSGTAAHFTPNATHQSQSGRATAPTQWTPASKPSTTWTPMSK